MRHRRTHSFDPEPSPALSASEEPNDKNCGSLAAAFSNINYSLDAAQPPLPKAPAKNESTECDFRSDRANHRVDEVNFMAMTNLCFLAIPSAPWAL
jgi:hypothetical protein